MSSPRPASLPPSWNSEIPSSHQGPQLQLNFCRMTHLQKVSWTHLWWNPYEELEQNSLKNRSEIHSKAYKNKLTTAPLRNCYQGGGRYPIVLRFILEVKVLTASGWVLPTPKRIHFKMQISRALSRLEESCVRAAWSLHRWAQACAVCWEIPISGSPCQWKRLSISTQLTLEMEMN